MGLTVWILTQEGRGEGRFQKKISRTLISRGKNFAREYRAKNNPTLKIKYLSRHIIPEKKSHNVIYQEKSQTKSPIPAPLGSQKSINDRPLARVLLNLWKYIIISLQYNKILLSIYYSFRIYLVRLFPHFLKIFVCWVILGHQSYSVGLSCFFGKSCNSCFVKVNENVRFSHFS